MRELTIFSRKLKKCLALTLAALVAVSGIPLTFSFRTEAAVEGKGTGDDPYIGHIYFASPSDVETPLYSVANTDKLTLVYNPPVKPKKTPALNSVFLVNSTDPSKSFYMWSGKAVTKNNRVEIAFDGLYQAAFDPDWQPYKGALVPGGTYYIECWDDANVNAYGDQSVCSRSQSVVTVAGEGGDEEAAWATATLVPDNKDTGAENVTYTLNLKPDRSFTVEAGESGFSLVLPDADFSDAAVTSDLVSGTPGKWGHSMQFEFKAGSTVTESDGISIVLSGVRNPDETTSHPVISGFVAEGGDDGRVVFEETKLDTLRYREAATLKSVYACVTTDLAGSSKAPVISMRADGSGNADSVTAVLEYEDKEKITQETPALSLTETETPGRYKYNYPITDEMKDITLKSVEFTLRAGDKTLTKTYSFGSKNYIPGIMELTITGLQDFPKGSVLYLSAKGGGSSSHRTIVKNNDDFVKVTIEEKADMVVGKEWRFLMMGTVAGVYYDLLEESFTPDSLYTEKTLVNTSSLISAEVSIKGSDGAELSADQFICDLRTESGNMITLTDHACTLLSDTKLTLCSLSTVCSDYVRYYDLTDSQTVYEPSEGRITITIKKRDAAASVSGTVTSEGAPVGGVTVSAFQQTGGLTVQSSAVTDASGHYSIEDMVSGVDAHLSINENAYFDLDEGVPGAEMTGTTTRDLTVQPRKNMIFARLSQLAIPGTFADSTKVADPKFSVNIISGSGDDKALTKADIEQCTEEDGGFYIYLRDDLKNKDVTVTFTAPALCGDSLDGTGCLAKVTLDDRGFGVIEKGGLIQNGILNWTGINSPEKLITTIYDGSGKEVYSGSAFSTQLGKGTFTAVFMGSGYYDELPEVPADIAGWKKLESEKKCLVTEVENTPGTLNSITGQVPFLTDALIGTSFAKAPDKVENDSVYVIDGALSIPEGYELYSINLSGEAWDWEKMSGATVGGKTALIDHTEVFPAEGCGRGNPLNFSIYVRMHADIGSSQTFVPCISLTRENSEGISQQYNLSPVTTVCASPLTITTVQRTDSPEVTVQGKTSKKGQVNIYEKDSLLATASADIRGDFSVKVNLCGAGGDVPSNHLLIAKSLVGYVPDENSVDYAAVSYVPGEAILKGIREYRNSPGYGSVITDLSISGGTTATVVYPEKEISYRYEVTFDRPEKLLESPCVYSDGSEGSTKAFVEVETDTGEVILPTREEGGKYVTEDTVFLSGALPTGVTVRYASEPGSGGSVTDPVEVSGTTASKSRSAAEDAIDTFGSIEGIRELSPDESDVRMEAFEDKLLEATASLYGKAAAWDGGSAEEKAKASVILSSKEPEKVDEDSTAITTQNGFWIPAEGTTLGKYSDYASFKEALGNDYRSVSIPDQVIRYTDPDDNVEKSTSAAFQGFTRLIQCDEKGQPLGDQGKKGKQSVMITYVAAFLSTDETGEHLADPDMISYERKIIMGPGTSFPYFKNDGTVAGNEPGASASSAGSRADALEPNGDVTEEAPPSTKTEWFPASVSAVKQWYSNNYGINADDISADTWIGLAMDMSDLIPVENEKIKQSMTGVSVANIAQATVQDPLFELNTIGDKLEYIRNDLVEMQKTYANVPGEGETMRKLISSCFDAYQEVDMMVEQAKITKNLAATVSLKNGVTALITGTMLEKANDLPKLFGKNTTLDDFLEDQTFKIKGKSFKVGKLFAVAKDTATISTSFVTFTVNSSADSSEAEAQRHFAQFFNGYMQLRKRASHTGYGGAGAEKPTFRQKVTTTTTTTVYKTLLGRADNTPGPGQSTIRWLKQSVIKTHTLVELVVTFPTGEEESSIISETEVEEKGDSENEVEVIGADEPTPEDSVKTEKEQESTEKKVGREKENQKDAKKQEQHDPSGVIYDAVLSNPVSGATVTLYRSRNNRDFKPEYSTDAQGMPDYSSDVINASDAIPGADLEEYYDDSSLAQSNPIITGKDGRYAWMVPEGLWFVTAHADGYEDGNSDRDKAAKVHLADTVSVNNFLPVLPPQLDVNIPLLNLDTPVVTDVRAQTDGVYVRFSRYMKEENLKASDFRLTSNGREVRLEDSDIVLCDSEQAPENIKYEGDIPSYTSLVHLNCELTEGKDVEVYVNTGYDMESYAGTAFGGVYSESMKVKPVPAVEAPAFSQAAGTYIGTQTVSISCGTEDADIFYSTDGGKTWKEYVSPIMLGESMTLTAKAVLEGYKDSESSAVYEIAGISKEGRIDLDIPESVTLEKGELRRIPLSARYLYGAEWKVIEGKAVSVRNGVLTGKKAGDAKVQLIYEGSEHIISVTVKDKAPDIAVVKGAGVSAKKTLKLVCSKDAGKKGFSEFAVKGTGKVKDGVVSAVSSSEKVCTVEKKDGDDGKWVVTATGPGAAYITWTVTGKDGEETLTVSQNTKVIVTRPLESDGIEISGDGLTETGGDVQKSVNLRVGQGVRLYADVTKDITDSAVLKWKSSNSSVKVSPQGYVIAVKPVKNNQPVTVTASLGKAKKSVTVNVTDMAAYMTMPKAAYTVKPGKKGTKVTIKPSYVPKDMSPDNVKWSVTTGSGTPVTDESVKVTSLEKGRGQVEVSSTAVRMTYYVTAVMEGLEPTTAELVVK